MITPLFKIEQSAEYITIKALLKYVKFSDFDYFIEENNFRLSLKPYHLNIYLSHPLDAMNANNSFTYDIEKQLLTGVIAKKEEGALFTGLNMLSTLFEKPMAVTATSTAPSMKVQEVSNTDNDGNDSKEEASNKLSDINTEEELNSYLFEQYSISESELDPLALLNSNTLITSSEFNYGFNNIFNDVFDKLSEDMIELLDLNPKKISKKYRYLAMLEKESYDFIPERYIYDTALLDPENEEGDHLRHIMSLSFTTHFSSLISNSMLLYNEKEIQVLQDINKTKLSFLNTDNHFEFYLQLIDVLFAYLYDMYTTEMEHSSESGWTINKVSAVFSNMIDFNKNFYSQSKEISIEILNELIKNVMIGCYRRVLVYPLYRNFDLCEKIKEDVKWVLNQEKVVLVKVLIEIRNIFEKSEPRYLFNTMYVDPYLKWIQFYSEEKIFKILAKVIGSVKISKDDTKLNLDHYEKEYELKGEECD